MPWRHIAYRAVRPLLFRFDSEDIHRLSLWALRLAGGRGAGIRRFSSSPLSTNC